MQIAEPGEHQRRRGLNLVRVADIGGQVRHQLMRGIGWIAALEAPGVAHTGRREGRMAGLEGGAEEQEMVVLALLHDA